MRKNLVLVMLLALPLIATTAWGQGFGVYEQSACTMGRGGATVAAPCEDGSAIFFNPAGLAFTNGLQLSVGGTVINPRGGFTPMPSVGGNPADLNIKYYPVPNVYIAKQTGKLVIGAGVFAPYGLTTDWPSNFDGRFLGYKTAVKGIYVQPTIAYKVNDNLALGGGVDITYASLELNQRIDLSSQYALAPGVHPLYPSGLTFGKLGVPAGTDFANVQLKGHGYRAGFHLGMSAKVADALTIGARYMSRERVGIDNGTFGSQQILTGRALPIALGPTIPAGTPIDALVKGQFSGTGSLADGQSVNTSIVFPDMFVAGIAVKMAAKTTLFADYQFTHWALFDQLVINRANSTSPTIMSENYRNTNGIHVGVEHQLNELLTVRGGFVGHSAAAPDQTVTPLLPEAARLEFAGGIGAKVARNLRADFAYQYLKQQDRAGRTVAVGNNVNYNFMSHLFGATMTVLF